MTLIKVLQWNCIKTSFKSIGNNPTVLCVLKGKAKSSTKETGITLTKILQWNCIKTSY